MKPKHIARARRFIGKRWYWRMRGLLQRRKYAFWDKLLISCENKDIPIYYAELERNAKKEAYYANKLNEKI